MNGFSKIQRLPRSIGFVFLKESNLETTCQAALNLTTAYIVILSLLILLLCFEVVRSIRKAIAKRQRHRERRWMPLYEKLEKTYEWERLSENAEHNRFSVIKGERARVRWDASPSANVVGYKLYWAIGGGVDYTSQSAEVGNATEVILPDQVSSFPPFPGYIEIGVTAVNDAGKESQMTKNSVLFGSKLQRPIMDSEADDENASESGGFSASQNAPADETRG